MDGEVKRSFRPGARSPGEPGLVVTPFLAPPSLSIPRSSGHSCGRTDSVRSPVCARKAVASTVQVPASRVAVVAEFRLPRLCPSLGSALPLPPDQAEVRGKGQVHLHLLPPVQLKGVVTGRSFRSWLRRGSRWPRRPPRLPDPSGRPPKTLCRYPPACWLPRWPASRRPSCRSPRRRCASR